MLPKSPRSSEWRNALRLCALRHYMQMKGLDVLTEEADWLIPVDDAFRLKHRDKSKQYPRPT